MVIRDALTFGSVTKRETTTANRRRLKQTVTSLQQTTLRPSRCQKSAMLFVADEVQRLAVAGPAQAAVVTIRRLAGKSFRRLILERVELVDLSI